METIKEQIFNLVSSTEDIPSAGHTLLSLHGPAVFDSVTELMFEMDIYLPSSEQIEGIKDRLMDLVCYLFNGLTSFQKTEAWNNALNRIVNNFTGERYAECLLASQIMKKVMLLYSMEISVPHESLSEGLRSMYVTIKTNELESSGIMTLCSTLETALHILLDDRDRLITDAICFLPSVILVSVLSKMSNCLSSDNRLITSISSSGSLWNKLLDCFNDRESSIRKKAIFLSNFLIASSVTPCPSILEELLVVLETLEESQSHIIRPVLAKIPKLYELVLEQGLDLRWIVTIFSRIMSQESRMISRWGMQLLLDLPITGFLTPSGLQMLEELLFAHLHHTYMFYRPNFIPKGAAPPIHDQLRCYLTTLLCESNESLSKSFLHNLLGFLSNTKASSTPLTMITHILSTIQLPYRVDEEFLDEFNLLCRVVLTTQPHKVKGAVQSFVLHFIANNVKIDSQEILSSLQRFLDLLFIEYTLDSGHASWIKLSLKVGECEPQLFTEHITKHLNAQKESSGRVQGFALLLAMWDEQGHLNDSTVSHVFQHLLNCGVNLYVSKSIVLTAMSAFTIVLKYFNHNVKSKTLNFFHQNCEPIFENCSLFFTRHSEQLFLGNTVSVESMKELKDVSYFLVEVALSISNDKKKVENLIQSLIMSIRGKSSEPLVLGQCSLLIQALLKNGRAEVYRFSGNPRLDWLLPYLSSKLLLHLESSWACFSFLCRVSPKVQKLDNERIFDLAVDAIQRMKDPCAIQIVFEFIAHITPDLITLGAAKFCESFPFTAGVLQDFTNSGVYWSLLHSFCYAMFHPAVMDHPECTETVIRTVEMFKDLTNSKERVIGVVVDHLCKYTSCKMVNAAKYINLFIDLSLFGVTQSREKQNQDDLIAFIEHLGDEIAVNNAYQGVKKGVPFVRVQVLGLLSSVIAKFPELSTLVINFYQFSFKSLDKSALQNSLPNRTKIRITQAILCLIPIVTRNLDDDRVRELLQEVVMCLTLDSQPSVRCFIECSAGYILSQYPSAVSTVYTMMRSSRKVTNCNALLNALFSILYRHIMFLEKTDQLTKQCLDETLQRISVWTCANNHNVRSFACSCLVLLAPVYEKNAWELSMFYQNQVDFIAESSDYNKLLSKRIEKNVFFSKFDIIDDLCLFNIFSSLPLQHNILENECLSKQEMELQSFSLDYPLFSGSFMDLPRPQCHEQTDYLIRFKDLTEFTSLQKKITPWQVMASNLGIEFDRSSTLKGDLIVYASLISKGNNLGGLSRTGEIFGIKSMVVNNFEILNNKDFKSLSMTSEKWVEFEEVPYDTTLTAAYFKKMKRLGYTIVGVEQASDSVSLEKFQFPRKTVLVLGRERDGIPVELLSYLDVCVEIPQLGLIRSLNVHVSASIMIWEYTKQHLIGKETVKSEGS